MKMVNFDDNKMTDCCYCSDQTFGGVRVVRGVGVCRVPKEFFSKILVFSFTIFQVFILFLNIYI